MHPAANQDDDTKSTDLGHASSKNPQPSQQQLQRQRGDEEGGSVHELVDGYFRARQADAGWGRLQQRLNKALTTALKKLEARLASLKQQADTGRQAGATQRSADLLMANAFRCGPPLTDAVSCLSVTMRVDESQSQVETTGHQASMLWGLHFLLLHESACLRLFALAKLTRSLAPT